MLLQLVVLVPFLLSSLISRNCPTSINKVRHGLGLAFLVPRLHLMLQISLFCKKIIARIFLLFLIFSPSATSHDSSSSGLCTRALHRHTYSITGYWQDSSYVLTIVTPFSSPLQLAPIEWWGLIFVFSLVLFFISEKIWDYSYFPFRYLTNSVGQARFVLTEHILEDLISYLPPLSLPCCCMASNPYW